LHPDAGRPDTNLLPAGFLPPSWFTSHCPQPFPPAVSIYFLHPMYIGFVRHQLVYQLIYRKASFNSPALSGNTGDKIKLLEGIRIYYNSEARDI
jgi:hypothetical protein